MLLHFRNKKWGSPNSFLRYEQLKPKYGMFLKGFPVARVLVLRHKNDLIFSSNNWCLIWYHNIAVK